MSSGGGSTPKPPPAPTPAQQARQSANSVQSSDSRLLTDFGRILAVTLQQRRGGRSSLIGG